MMTKDEIQHLTQSLGEGWASSHVQRVIRLAGRIAGSLAYHPDWFWYAAYLHDWGAFPRYRLPGVDHALRSRQIAESEILPACGLPAEAIPVILEAIERHDYRDPRPVNHPEALLLREADFLDFIGPLGVARDFAWGPNNLAQVIQRIRSRVAGIRGRFTLPLAQEIGEQRILEMENLLARIERIVKGIYRDIRSSRGNHGPSIFFPNRPQSIQNRAPAGRFSKAVRMLSSTLLRRLSLLVVLLLALVEGYYNILQAPHKQWTWREGVHRLGDENLAQFVEVTSHTVPAEVKTAL